MNVFKSLCFKYLSPKLTKLSRNAKNRDGGELFFYSSIHPLHRIIIEQLAN